VIVMRGLIGAGALALALAFGQSAFAADQAPVAARPAAAPAVVVNPYSWTGVYLGVNGGWGWGTARQTFAGPSTTGNFDVSGGVFGGTIGANWQGAVWTTGLEADLDWSNIGGNAGFCPFGPGYTCRTEIDWLGTLRGRLGMARNNFLFYATAGFAFAPVHLSITGPTNLGSTKLQGGFVGGAGIEAALQNNLSVKAEWLFVALEQMTCVAPSCGKANVVGTFRTNLLRVGLNRRF
jgi:outer membrane immunogenic protein